MQCVRAGDDSGIRMRRGEEREVGEERKEKEREREKERKKANPRAGRRSS